MKFKFAVAFFLAPLAAFSLLQGPSAQASGSDQTTQRDCFGACNIACSAQECAGLPPDQLQTCQQICRDGCSCNCGLLCN